MGDKGADAAAKQGFLRFAARGDNRGISIKMGGDMLGALSGSQLPGFAQRAAMKMIDRNSDNVRGVENVQDFVEAPQVRAMPTMARGRATEVLAKGDGTDEVRQGLEDVAGAEGFRGLPRSDKARLFATIGQGKASELRAITDQTLVALRTANFPTQSAQVSRFLGGLSRQIAKGNGTGQDIDPKALLRQAKRGNMPAMPKLLSTVDNDDEEAQSQARSHNRAALMRYYSQVSEHYDGIEGQIKNAKYFEDVNLLTGLKQAALPDTQGILKVSDEARADVEGEMGQLNQALANRTLTRPDYMAQVRALQTKALGRADLTADEKTWVGVVTADALNAQTFQDLAGKKNRKLREVGKNLMPAAKRRRLGQERRTVSAQPRYFRAGEADGKQGAARLATLPLPGRQPGAQGTSGMNPNVEAQLRQLVTGLQQLLSSGGKQDLGQKLAKLTQGLSQGAGAPQSPAPTKRPVASKAGTQGKTDGWGIPRTFERDLGATANVVPVRAAEGKDSASSPPGYDTAVGASPPSYSEATAGDVPPDYETPRSETAQVNVVRANAKLRDLSTLYGLPWKQLTKDESNVFRNLGWDMATWNAKGQPGARLPVSLRTTFSSLSPKERSSVQALGFSQSEWDAYVEGVSGQ